LGHPKLTNPTFKIDIQRRTLSPLRIAIDAAGSKVWL